MSEHDNGGPALKPIPFSAPMVRAVLAGTKTQTRRPLRPGTWWTPEHGVIRMAPAGLACTGFALVPCPYGKPGDRLWVREAWGIADKWLHDCETDPPRCIAYRADLAARNFDPVYDVDTRGWAFAPNMKWRPSIHMHRWASRITLEVTAVRVERLQDISEADAQAEGIGRTRGGDGWGLPDGEHYHCEDPRHSYLSLWESINGPGSVEANPRVWVVEFRRIQHEDRTHG